jgi:hypothetical protein
MTEEVRRRARVVAIGLAFVLPAQAVRSAPADR